MTASWFRAAAIALALSGCASLPGSEGRFDVGIIGDMPYTKVQAVEYRRTLAALNEIDLALVAHVGDFEFDATPYNRDPSVADMPCVEENYRSVLASFQSVRHPFVYTPGDNDWSDCAPLAARKVDVLDLLDRLRALFFPEGRSLGQRPIAVLNQSSDPRFARFRENLRWKIGGVVFVTVHTVGSNDNTGRGARTDAEQAERKAANIAWLRAAFAEAADAKGLVILTQANPGFENFWPASARTRYFLPFVARGQPVPQGSSAFADYVRVLAEELENFRKPVAYIHGDTHLFRIDKPLYSAKSGRAFENFTRLETFGWPDTHWVRVTVDPADPQLFRFKPEIIPENATSRVRR